MRREELSKEIQQFFGEIKQREKDLAEAKADLKSIGEAMVTARLSADVAMLRELAAESKEAEEKVLQCQAALDKVRTKYPELKTAWDNAIKDYNDAFCQKVKAYKAARQELYSKFSELLEAQRGMTADNNIVQSACTGTLPMAKNFDKLYPYDSAPTVKYMSDRFPLSVEIAFFILSGDMPLESAYAGNGVLLRGESHSAEELLHGPDEEDAKILRAIGKRW